MTSENVSPAVLVELYRSMLFIRRFEEKIVDVYPEQDMKTPVHLSIGEEAIAAGVCILLGKDDYMFTTHRSHGHCLAKGISPALLYAEFYGRATGCCKGKGGSMHPASKELSIPGTSAIVGGGIPIAVGTALASKMKGDNNVSVVFFGDGAVEEGSFSESLNFASLKKLPVVFVCENNFYAVNSPLSQRQPHSNIARHAESYDIPGVQADGNNVVDVYLTARTAIDRARSGGGPTLVEYRTYRWKGHVGPDCDHEKGCRLKEELEDWQGRCPVDTYEKFLLKNGIITSDKCETMLREIDSEVESAFVFAKNSPLPDTEELYKDVYHTKR